MPQTMARVPMLIRPAQVRLYVVHYFTFYFVLFLLVCFKSCSLICFLFLKSQYKELVEIGSGAYGTVFRARDMQNHGQMVALKKVRVPLTENGVPVTILREITVLRQLQNFDHPNIVK